VWQPSLDFQLNWRPNFLGLNRRLSMSFMTVNFVGGLDRLLHGENGLHGWGQFRGQDNTLLYVRGFDAATNSYRYEVNERFGASRNGANAITVPFQIGFQARYTLGPDRMRDMLDGMIRGRGGPGGFGGGGRFAAGAPGQPNAGGPGGGGAGMNFNPIAQVIQLKDSLGLSEAQVAQLQPLADSVTARNTALGAEIQKAMREAGANPDMGAVMRTMQPKLEQMRRENDAWMKRVESVLTAEQWAKVPDRVKNAGRGQRQGAQQRRPPGE